MSGTEDVSGLCCCEYHTCQGERAHLLQLCCDCEALDSAVDSLVSGRGVKSDTVRCVTGSYLSVLVVISAVKRSIGSTTGCTITEKAPTRAFS